MNSQYVKVLKNRVTFYENKAIKKGIIPKHNKYCSMLISYNEGENFIKFYCKYCNKKFKYKLDELYYHNKILAGHNFNLTNTTVFASCGCQEKTYATISSRYNKLIKEQLNKKGNLHECIDKRKRRK